MTILSFCHIQPELWGKSVTWSETNCTTSLQFLSTSEPPAEGKAWRLGEELSLCLWAVLGLMLPAPVIWVRVFALFAAVQSLLLPCTSKPGLPFPHSWLSFGASNLWRAMLEWPLAVTPLIGKAGHRGWKDSHWHQHHSDHGPVGLVLCSSWESRAIPVNKRLRGSRKCSPSGLPGALFSIHVGTTCHTCLKI